MIPHLPTLNEDRGSAGATPVVQVPPPPRFRPAKDVKLVRLGSDSGGGTGTTTSQRSGVRYERQVLDNLESRFPSFIRSPMVHFEDVWGWRTCIPDGILFPEVDLAVAVEIKFQHMPEAWWQLRRLYEPVLRVLYPRKRIGVLEICRSFDPLTPFPEAPKLLESLTELSPSAFNVLRWRRA